jgi:hypothetical protein
MIPRYTPSIMTRSPARRAPPTHKGSVTSPGLPTRTRSQSIDWRSFHTSMLGNLKSFLGNSPGLTAGGPGSTGVVLLPGTFLTSEGLRARTARGGLLCCEYHTVLFANLPSSKPHELRPFEVRIWKLISWNLVKNWLGSELWRFSGSQLGGVSGQRRCTSEKPCFEWNAKFLLMNSDVGYVIAAWRRQSEIILRIENPSFPGAVWRDPWWELYAENHVETKCSGMSLTSAFLE